MTHSLKKKSVYLDYNATAPLRPEAKDALLESLEDWANPSTLYSPGRLAHSYLESARECLASQLDCKPRQVIFTSGGSESNTMLIKGMIQKGVPLFISSIEHDSVRMSARTTDAMVIPVTQEGVVDLDSLEHYLKKSATPCLVSVMAANNETGVRQPIPEIVALTHARGGWVHTDATQVVGKRPLSFASWGADAITLSSHKVGGPVGAGALIVREELNLSSLIMGGKQEGNHRAGTENVPAIRGMVAAIACALHDDWDRIEGYRDRLEAALKRYTPSIKIYGEGQKRLPNTSCFSTEGLNQEQQLMRLDLAGIYIGTGSACGSRKIKPSHVLLAMGATEAEARCAIRVSLGWNSTLEDIEDFLAVWKDFMPDTSRECVKSLPPDKIFKR